MNSPLTVSERILSSGNLTIDEFAAWQGLGRVTVYKEIKAGRLVVTKYGKASRITAPDAIAYRDARRAATRAREVA